MSERTNFLDIPVEGDIRGSSRRPQRPIEEFTPIIQAVLDDPAIIAFGWCQYTPIRIDGDERVFGAHSTWFRTDADPPSADTGDLILIDHHPTLGSRRSQWSSDGQSLIGPDKARFDRCHALHEAITEGEFDDFLLLTYGDHAEISVTRQVITVNEYDHDHD